MSGIVDLYEEAHRIYHASLEAMGQAAAPVVSEIRSSADVIVSLDPSQSLLTDKWRTGGIDEKQNR